jgi:DNA-binding transcriptional ArsR family regulator
VKICIQLFFTKEKLHKMHSLKIEERRRKIASLLAQSLTESEIAQELNVDQSTISRDIKALKEQSQRFIYDLAKSDLAYYYKQCIDGIEQVKRKAWKAYRSNDSSLKLKDKHLALKLVKECDEAKFALFKEGPSVMNLKSLEERLSKIESNRQISK